MLGRACAGQAATDAIPGAVYAFLGIARGEDRDTATARLLTEMTSADWRDIRIERADPLSPSGLPCDESLLAALRQAAMKGAAFVLFPDPLQRINCQRID